MANVYYSVCPYGTGDIKTGSPTISITSGVATLSVAQTGNIGQGCRITYDTSSVCYISQVNSSTSFNVVTATGGTPSDTSGSKTVNSIAHEYASLSAAEAGATDSNHINNTDLTTVTTICNLVCYYDHDDQTKDTSVVTVDGWTTSSSYYVNIYTPTGGTQSINNNRHAGVLSTIKYILEPNITTGICLYAKEDATKITGLQIVLPNTATNYCVCVGLGNGNGQTLQIDKCIMKYAGGATSQQTAGCNTNLATNSTNTIRNCVLYDFIGTNTYTASIQCDENCTINAYNCTVHNSYKGMRRSNGTVTATNVGCASCTTAFDGTITQTTCSSSAPTFANEAGDDFHLASGDTTWKNAGTDSSGTFTDDIDGETRPTGAGTWDIGADEYVAGGASSNLAWKLAGGKASLAGIGGLAG